MERPEGEVVLNDIWFAYSEAKMSETLHKDFVDAYATERKYAPILQDLRDASEVAGEFSRPGPPFRVIDGLFYNNRPDGTYSLCIP